MGLAGQNTSHHSQTTTTDPQDIGTAAPPATAEQRGPSNSHSQRHRSPEEAGIHGRTPEGGDDGEDTSEEEKLFSSEVADNNTGETNAEEARRHSGDDDGSRRRRRTSALSHHSDRSARSSSADSIDLEMLSDDNLNDDEETGLTTHQRRKKRRLKKLQRRSAAGTASVAETEEMKLSLAAKKLADKNVVRKLLINAVFILLWYIFSVSISLYNNWMFDPHHLNFSYPLFTSSLHMLVQFGLASLLLYFFPSLRPRNPAAPHAAVSMTGHVPNTKAILSKTFYFTRLVPCGTATSLDIGLGNMSLKFITLSFLTMCKSSTLGFVLIFAFILGLERLSFKLILIICVMTVGVVMMVADEATFNVIGFALVISSAFFSGFRWALTQVLLLRHPATGNPFSSLFFLTPIMFVSLFILACLIEGPSQILDGIAILNGKFGVLGSIVVLVFPGSLAFCMIASEFALLRRSSVVTLSICGIFKEVITIGAAGILYGERLAPINVAGVVLTTACIGTYNYIKITKMRTEAQKDVVEGDDETDSESDDDEYDSHHHHAGPSRGGILGTSIGKSSSNEGTRAYKPVPNLSDPEAAVDGPSYPQSASPMPVLDEEDWSRSSIRSRVNGAVPG